MDLEVISRYPLNGKCKNHLLFVHGAWHSAWCWDRYFLPYFAQEGFAAHAVSLRGHGGSEHVRNIHLTRIAHYVEDVAKAADSLPESPVVIGHSMGGFVVQKYLESFTAPAGILLASAPPRGMLWPLLRLARRHPFAFIKSNIIMSTKSFVATPTLTREILFSFNTSLSVIKECMDNLTEESLLAFLDILILNKIKTSNIASPLMIIGAGADNFFDSDDIDSTAKTYNTRPIYIENTGHDMMLEEGWKNVADKMIEWLGTLKEL